MATRKTTRKAAPRKTANRATDTSTHTSRSGVPDPGRTASRARRAPVPTEEVAPRETMVAAHKVAAENVLQDASTGRFTDTVGEQESRISQAMRERAQKVEKKNAEIARNRKERQERRTRKVETAPLRVPADADDATGASSVDSSGYPVTQVPVGARGAYREVGTGVADPDDLAPGQSLEPSPPGGVAIAPLPDKPGTNFSKLK